MTIRNRPLTLMCAMDRPPKPAPSAATATDSQSAILLVAHGSPDPDWRRPLEAAHRRLQALLPNRKVALAYMELCGPSVLEAASELEAQGHRSIVVMAAFLSPGGRHIKRHLPEIVERVARERPALELELLPGSLGNEPEVIEALARAATRLAGG